MFAFPASSQWYLWGVALLIGLPVLTLTLSEIIHNLERGGRDETARAVNFIRNTCLPLLFIVLLLRNVVGLDSNSLAVRIADTAFWITVINAALAVFNMIFFGDDAAGSWRGRVPKLFLDLLRLFFVLFGAAIVVSTVWNVDLGGLLTALGVGSIVIGLALQDTLGSLFSGIALLSARHYKVGDWIKVADQEGIVVTMNWRSVTIRTRDGDFIVLPNVALAKERVRTISSFAGWHAEFVYFNIAYDHPPELVKRLMLEAAAATPGILTKPPPHIRLLDYGDYAIRYQAQLFVDNYQRLPVIMNEYRSVFWYIAQRNSIEFPARNNRLYRRSGGGRPAGTADPTTAELAKIVSDFGVIPRPAGDLEPLLRNARYLRYRQGENLLNQGHSAGAVYILAEGRASVRKFSRSGQKEPVEIDELETGQLVLFKALFRDKASPFTVTAATETAVIAIPPSDFIDYLNEDVSLGSELERIISLQEDTATRILKSRQKAINGAGTGTGAEENDRVQILQDLFRS